MCYKCFLQIRLVYMLGRPNTGTGGGGGGGVASMGLLTKEQYSDWGGCLRGIQIVNDHNKDVV